MTDISKSSMYNLPFGFEEVCDLYEKSMIDYQQRFTLLYASYNAWYRRVTVTTNDRKAINILKTRVAIWEDYRNGLTMIPLKAYMKRLIDVTQKRPLRNETNHWDGEIHHINDWQSLIEYWYQVRCKIVHGMPIESIYAWLVYETLDIFMQEIIYRARECIKEFDLEQLRHTASQFEFNQTDSPRLKELHQKMVIKYSAMPDIWQVDIRSSA